MRRLIALLLLVPLAQGAELHWMAPEEVAIGSPINAAYMVLADGTTDLQGHVDVWLQVYLDDELLIDSSSLHEHDGFHGALLTAPREGTIRLVGTPAQGEASEARIKVVAPEEIQPVAVTLTRSGTDFRVDPHDHAEGAHYENVHALWAIHQDGNLHYMANEFIHFTGGTTVHPSIGGAMNAYITAADNSPDVRSTGVAIYPIPLDEVPLEQHPLAAAMAASAQTNTCQTQFLLDPAPTLPDVWSWAPFTDIRISVPTLEPQYQGGNGAGLRYELQAYTPQPTGEQWTQLWSVYATDPWMQLTFRPPMPGDYRLAVYDSKLGGEACYVPIAITELDLPLGSLDADIIPNEQGVSAVFTSKASDGTTLDHYEFDTLVVRTSDEGRLVWKSKLHGHAGVAAFTLNNLESGDYEIHVFPSAQSQDQPALAKPDGFVYRFSLNVTAEDGLNVGVPAPFALAPFVVGYLLKRRQQLGVVVDA